MGINQFQDSRFRPLQFATDDAQALASALAEFDDVKVMVRPEQTTRPAILEALAELERKALQPRDTVLLYFSTHGTLAQRPGGALQRILVTADTRMDLAAETGLSIDELIRMTERLGSRRVVLVIASCHSGKGKSQHSDALAEALERRKAFPLRPLEEVSEAVMVLTAAAFSEAAQEHPALGHDVYTHFLLEGLEKGDRDGNGAVTASEAHDYARERTYAFTQGAQRPTAESDILGVDPIVLRGQAWQVGRPVIYSYAGSAEGINVVLNGAVKGALPGGVAAEVGRNALELKDARSGATLYRDEVWLEPGEALEVSTLLPRPRVLRVGTHLGTVLALSAPLQDAYLPAAWLGGVRASWENGLWSGSRVSVSGSVMSGSGTAPGAGERLPFQLSGLWWELGVHQPLQVTPAFALVPGMTLGISSLSRQFQLPGFSSRESLRGLHAGGQLGLEWRAHESLRLGGELGVMAAWARLGASLGPHPLGRLSLYGTWAF